MTPGFCTYISHKSSKGKWVWRSHGCDVERVKPPKQCPVCNRTVEVYADAVSGEQTWDWPPK